MPKPRKEGVYARSGSQFLQLRYFDETGALVRRSAETGDWSVAQAKLKALQDEVLKRIGLKGQPTFEEAAIAVINACAETTTMRCYKWRLMAWLATLGEERAGKAFLTDLTVADVERHVTRRRLDGRAAQTIRHELHFLSKLYSYFHVKPNPVDDYDKRQLPRGKMIKRFATLEEEQAILNHVERTLYHDMIVTAVETGLRKGEMIRLRWDQVQLIAREIQLGEDTKDDDPRIIPISDRLVSVLKRRSQVRDAHCPWVFPNPEGQPYSDVKEWWGPLVRQAGVANFRWHDWRHTFATRWLKDGGDLATLQKALGHSKVETTMRYVYLVNRDVHDAFGRIEQRRKAYGQPHLVPKAIDTEPAQKRFTHESEGGKLLVR